jgi:hypothetical protein
MALACVLVVGLASVGSASVREHPPDIALDVSPVWQPVAGLSPVWVQLAEPGVNRGVVSDDVAGCTDCASLAADDFECEAGATISAVEWWGECSLATADAIDSFVLRFFGDGQMLGYGCPGPEITERVVPASDLVIEKQGYRLVRFFARLSSPVNLGGSDRYWIGIQAIRRSPGVEPWRARLCRAEDFWQDEAVLKSETSGIHEWTPVGRIDSSCAHGEIAFVLYADCASGVEGSSWSEIKALFK